MLINISNHLSSTWTEGQMAAATRLFGEVCDLSFPRVPPEADPEHVELLAAELLDSVRAIGTPIDVTLHVMGEMTLTYRIVQKAIALGYNCVASTTERVVSELPDGQKLSHFEFVRFRNYV